MHSTRRVIYAVALIAFVIGAISAAIAGEWDMFVLALLGGAAVALWPKPVR
jgi:fucose permease